MNGSVVRAALDKGRQDEEAVYFAFKMATTTAYDRQRNVNRRPVELEKKENDSVQCDQRLSSPMFLVFMYCRSNFFGE